MRHYAKLLRATLTAVLMLVAVSGALAGLLEDADDAYDRGDYTTALRLYRALADQGNADAQNSLGAMTIAAMARRRTMPKL